MTIKLFSKFQCISQSFICFARFRQFLLRLPRSSSIMIVEMTTYLCTLATDCFCSKKQGTKRCFVQQNPTSNQNWPRLCTHPKVIRSSESIKNVKIKCTHLFFFVNAALVVTTTSVDNSIAQIVSGQKESQRKQIPVKTNSRYQNTSSPAQNCLHPPVKIRKQIPITE